MTSAIDNLSSGLFGGALGGLLAFGAAWLTIVKTREADRRREERRDAELAEQRRVDFAAQFAGTFQAFESEIRWAPFLNGRAAARLIEANAVFYASQGANHPNVALWLLGQVERHQVLMREWRRRRWIPVIGSRRLSAIAKDFGELGAVIAVWAAGQATDDDFVRTDVSPAEIIEAANRRREEVA